jgi:hypothetical protein
VTIQYPEDTLPLFKKILIDSIGQNTFGYIFIVHPILSSICWGHVVSALQHQKRAYFMLFEMDLDNIPLNINEPGILGAIVKFRLQIHI